MNIFEALECVRAGYAVRHADWPAGTSLQLRHGYPALIEEAAHCSGVTTLSHLHERIPPAQLESTHWETVAVDGISVREVTFSETSRPLNEAILRCDNCGGAITGASAPCPFCGERASRENSNAPEGARVDYDISMTSRVMHIEAELADAEKHPELLQLINRLYRKHGASIAIDNLARAMAGGQRVPAQIVYGPGGRQRARAGAQHTCLDQAGDVVGLAALGRAGTPYPEAPHVFDDTRIDSSRRQLDGIRHIIDGLGYKAPEQHESERLRIAVAIEQLQKTFML